MPLVVITGYPSSGKSSAATKLKKYFQEDKGKAVTIVSEAALIAATGSDKNKVFNDSGKEKAIRGNFKSEILRSLSKDVIVIADGLNYIKGFRYELFCASKSLKTTQVTLHCDVSAEDAWAWNDARAPAERAAPREAGTDETAPAECAAPREVGADETAPAERAAPRETGTDETAADDTALAAELAPFTLSAARPSSAGSESAEPYTRPVFDGLVMRYETPVAANRWDAPLFLAIRDVDLAVDAIHDALFVRKAPPPNQSTQCQPLSSATFLHELDSVTKEVNVAVLSAQKLGPIVDDVPVGGSSERIRPNRSVTMAELARTKRQFIVYAKTRAVEDVAKLKTMYVQYMNSSLFAE